MQTTANGNSIMKMQKSAAIETAGFQLSDKYMEVLPTGHFLRHAHGLPQKDGQDFCFFGLLFTTSHMSGVLVLFLQHKDNKHLPFTGTS